MSEEHSRMLEELRQERDKEFEQAINLHHTETQRILTEKQAKYDEMLESLQSKLDLQGKELEKLRASSTTNSESVNGTEVAEAQPNGQTV